MNSYCIYAPLRQMMRWLLLLLVFLDDPCRRTRRQGSLRALLAKSRPAW